MRIMDIARFFAGLTILIAWHSASADENSKYRTVDGGYSQNGEVSSYRARQVHEHDLAWLQIDDKCFPATARRALAKLMLYKPHDFAFIDLDGDGIDEIIVSYGNRPTGSPEPEIEILKSKNNAWKVIGGFRGLFILTWGREDEPGSYYKITSYYNMYGHQRIAITTHGKVGYRRMIESINPMPIVSFVPFDRSPHHSLLYKSNNYGCDRPPQPINKNIKHTAILGDVDEPMRLAHMEADQGNPYAFLLLGEIYNSDFADQDNLLRAVKWYRAAADAGIPQAQFNLGMMYRDGMGVPLDYAEAEKWIEMAAKGGTRNSAISGELNFSEQEYYRRAVKGHRASAEAGVPQAQFSLGMMYQIGMGVPPDHAEAEKWIGLAVKEGTRKPAKSGQGWRKEQNITPIK
ncbi:tetratricopeptide repeat protein [Magnetospirillum sp. ME-1]|uniref:tetratricopeptide repeat protein n=1 Tax=Magnetospirillum sp. ME-1 TaxID=1639348 RepID=UPI000A18D974|nr:tetratricopeptide repeat protein [Magnetospirillum sp. ME-1]